MISLNSIKWVSLILLITLPSFFEPIQFVETMKVHPIPKKRNISFHYDTNSSLNRQKKLRRLPHIFNKVLELPFHSEADVIVEESRDCFRFVATTEDVGHDIRTHTIEIHPGVTKVVLRGRNVLELNLDELQLDLWRFRLPPCTKPELASAVYVDGELIVTVPKDVDFVDDEEDGNDEDDEEVWGEGNEDLRGGGVGRLVLVQ